MNKKLKKIIFLLAIFLLISNVLLIGSSGEIIDRVILSQIDSANFPEIQGYFYVMSDNNETIKGLNHQNIKLTEKSSLESERVENSLYLEEMVSERTNLAIALSIDTSGSMGANQMNQAKTSAINFIESLNSGDRVAIIEFNTIVNVVEDFTNDHEKAIQAVNSLSARGRTAMYDSIYKSLELLNHETGVKCIIMFTDGDDNESNYDMDDIILRANEEGVPIYTIALGAEVRHKNILENIAQNTNAQFYDSPRASDLIEIYNSIATIQRSQYYFRYRTHNPLPDGTQRDVEITVNYNEKTQKDNRTYIAPEKIHKNISLDIGDQINYYINQIQFNMRLAPAATIPTEINNNKIEIIDKEFLISETQVTYELWYEVRTWAENNGYTFVNKGREGSMGLTGSSPTENKNQPVTYVNWRDAVVWTNALSELKGLDPVYRYNGEIIKNAFEEEKCDNAEQTNNNGFRLPTEWEWELAARYIGKNKPIQSPLREEAIFMNGYYWTPGNYASGAYDNINNHNENFDVAWYEINSTKEVGLKRANQLGLYDMSGNVFEWCFNWKVDSKYRAIRGGSWLFKKDLIQIAYQELGQPIGNNAALGFRIVKPYNVEILLLVKDKNNLNIYDEGFIRIVNDLNINYRITGIKEIENDVEKFENYNVVITNIKGYGSETETMFDGIKNKIKNSMQNNVDWIIGNDSIFLLELLNLAKVKQSSDWYPALNDSIAITNIKVNNEITKNLNNLINTEEYLGKDGVLLANHFGQGIIWKVINNYTGRDYRISEIIEKPQLHLKGIRSGWQISENETTLPYTQYTYKNSRIFTLNRFWTANNETRNKGWIGPEGIKLLNNLINHYNSSNIQGVKPPDVSAIVYKENNENIIQFDKVNNADRYEIWRREINGKWKTSEGFVVVDNSNETIITWTDRFLKEDTDYEYIIRALNKDIAGEFTNVEIKYNGIFIVSVETDAEIDINEILDKSTNLFNVIKEGDKITITKAFDLYNNIDKYSGIRGNTEFNDAIIQYDIYSDGKIQTAIITEDLDDALIVFAANKGLNNYLNFNGEYLDQLIYETPKNFYLSEDIIKMNLLSYLTAKMYQEIYNEGFVRNGPNNHYELFNKEWNLYNGSGKEIYVIKTNLINYNNEYSWYNDLKKPIHEKENHLWSPIFNLPDKKANLYRSIELEYINKKGTMIYLSTYTDNGMNSKIKITGITSNVEDLTSNYISHRSWFIDYNLTDSYYTISNNNKARATLVLKNEHPKTIEMEGFFNWSEYKQNVVIASYGEIILSSLETLPLINLDRNSSPLYNKVLIGQNKSIKKDIIETEKTSYSVDTISFNMRLAPKAIFPTSYNEIGKETVDKAFWIAETQVTYELWYEVRTWAENKGYTFVNKGREGSTGIVGENPSLKRKHPVTDINWYDAIVWLNALSEMKGLHPIYRYNGNILRDATNSTVRELVEQTNNNGFRLPTEWEWELASRYIGKNKPSQTPLRDEAVFLDGIFWTPENYASGAYDNINNNNKTFDVAWFKENSQGRTHEVALKRANHLGLYDMSGNVWEWCYDSSNSSKKLNIVRGGSWKSSSELFQLSKIIRLESKYNNDITGFRIVKNYDDLIESDTAIGTGFLTGVVKSSNTNENLSGIKILVKNDDQEIIKEKYTDEQGEYFILLSTGEYNLSFIHDEYLDVDYDNVKIEYNISTHLRTVYLEFIKEIIELGNAQGIITNAIDGQGLENVLINLRRGINVESGDIVKTTTTSSSGEYYIKDLEPGNYTAEVFKTGFVKDFFTIVFSSGQTRNNQNYSITPELSDEQIRIVLTWGEKPKDLDSHLTGPKIGEELTERFHIYYQNRKYSFSDNRIVELDVDITNSFGPETITIHNQTQGIYRYSVHDYTNRKSINSNALSSSNARVEVYQGSTRIATFHVPNQAGTLWKVFEMEGNTITPKNKITYMENESRIR